MSVSSELLCSFELLKPLDSNALKSHIKKGRNKRQQMLNSPVCCNAMEVYSDALRVPADIPSSPPMCILRAFRVAHGIGIYMNNSIELPESTSYRKGNPA